MIGSRVVTLLWYAAERYKQTSRQLGFYHQESQAMLPNGKRFKCLMVLCEKTWENSALSITPDAHGRYIWPLRLTVDVRLQDGRRGISASTNHLAEGPLDRQKQCSNEVRTRCLASQSWWVPRRRRRGSRRSDRPGRETHSRSWTLNLLAGKNLRSTSRCWA